MFGADSSGVSGQKVAVTATTLSDASYTFSNYNGRHREKACGYQYVRPDRPEDETFIWEAGRVTSAAPGSFRPAFIASLGSFQDGGLRHNNPTELALWECSKLWASNTRPDVVLSLGTGTSDDLELPKAPNFRNIFNDGFVPRLWRSFMASLNGERSWRNLYNSLDGDSKADYYRLNVPFAGEEPRLDDIQCMEALKSIMLLQPEDKTTIAFALLAASFYFELDRVPSLEAGRYYCSGFVRCRNDSRAVLASLSRLHGQLGFATDIDDLGVVKNWDVCSCCHNYCKRVQFSVRNLDGNITIGLEGRAVSRRKISGFPHSMAWFVREQQLDAPFGNTTHAVPLRYRCHACKSSEDASTPKIKQAPGKLVSRAVVSGPSSCKDQKRKFEGVLRPVHKRRKLGR